MTTTPTQPEAPRATDDETSEDRIESVPDLLARRFAGDTRTYWETVWDYFRANRPAFYALWMMLGMGVMAALAPYIANHRPFFMIIGQGVLTKADEDVLHQGWNFPLFANLRVSDWVLLFGGLQAVVAFVTYRRSKRSRLVVSRNHSVAMLAIAVVPVILALAFSPRIRDWITGESVPATGFLGQGSLWWILVAAAAIVGAGLLLLNWSRLFWQKADQFGNFNPLSNITWLVVGTIIFLVPVSMIGTLGRRALDTTDYFAISLRDNVSALFPPIAHDYLASNTYMVSQPPLGPETRVQQSGGSRAAADLNLSDNRRDLNLAATIAPPPPGSNEDNKASDSAATTNNPWKLTRDLPLSRLNNGDGVRLSELGGTDFIVVSHSFANFSVSLEGCKTLGDVIDRINDATNGKVQVRISPDGTKLDFVDNTPRRPTYWMGTDPSGSDVAARLVRATRVALSIGFVSTSIALTIGIIMGSLMGYFGGWVDIVGMRIIEIFMAIPRLFLLLTIIAFIPPQWNDYMLYAMMAVIGATSWMGAARFIRAEFFKLRDQDFVLSAKACGLPMRSILFKHMLPNGVTPVLVDASFGVAAAIFVETGLSFLGFGIKPPHPSWGQMLSSAVDPGSGVFRYWLAIFPGMMIFLTVFGFNLIGDALRDAIDPKLKKAAEV